MVAMESCRGHAAFWDTMPHELLHDETSTVLRQLPHPLDIVRTSVSHSVAFDDHVFVEYPMDVRYILQHHLDFSWVRELRRRRVLALDPSLERYRLQECHFPGMQIKLNIPTLFDGLDFPEELLRGRLLRHHISLQVGHLRFQIIDDVVHLVVVCLRVLQLRGEAGAQFLGVCQLCTELACGCLTGNVQRVMRLLDHRIHLLKLIALSAPH
mmetsp:Transcript_116760/g.330311  ORF Transcript_116760/g.330311 Transcript_116760/m.330311 type:complete len:211 (-) Transcript_116760:639-1271(-)